jgi:hypothetical protein
MARAELEAVIAELGLEVRSVFVPWSKSRNFKEGVKVGERTLNWKISVVQWRGDRERVVLSGVDYSAGIAHCPAYKKYGYERVLAMDGATAIEYETEHGRRSFRIDSLGHASGAVALLPDPCDVLSSLALDSDAIDYPTFEEWADNSGYDPDSRKGEAIYRQCLETALNLRAGLGEEGLRKLWEAAQDY